MKGLKYILVVLAALLTSVNLARADSTCKLAERIDDRMIVAPRPGQSMDAFIDQFHANNPDINAVVIDQVPRRALYLVELTLPPDFTPADGDMLELSLETDYTSLIRFAELLYTDETPEGTTGSTLVDAVADNTIYQGQYARGQINIDQALPISTGLGVVVAIVDTGVDVTHPLLAPQIAPGGFNFVENNTNVADVGTGIDVDGDGLIDEGVGHGTFVAGLITLVAPNARILPVRVLDGEGNGDLWTLTRGLFHAIDRGVEVINVSISSTYNSAAVEDALNEAENHGIVVVAAAGNCNADDPREYPAMRSGALGVAAVNENDVKAPFSNFSDRLFISAPGDSVLEGPSPDDARSIISLTPNGGMGYWEGTSMAAPLVTGAVALIRAQHPEWARTAITVSRVENALENSATNINAQNPGYAGELGAGRINVGAAVADGPMTPTLGDLNASGDVDVFDLFQLLQDWNTVHTSADLNGDGTANVFDLFILLGNWG